MRVGLAPFSVKFLTVVTGSINTALHKKLPPSQLPQDSIYTPDSARIWNNGALEFHRPIRIGDLRESCCGRCTRGKYRETVAWQ